MSMSSCEDKEAFLNAMGEVEILLSASDYEDKANTKTTNGYVEHTIDLEYRREGVKPKYLVFVASSCKYGDYFTGSMSSVLYLDEVEFIY